MADVKLTTDEQIVLQKMPKPKGRYRMACDALTMGNRLAHPNIGKRRAKDALNGLARKDFVERTPSKWGLRFWLSDAGLSALEEKR